MTICERVKRLGLPLGEYAVFGSGLLEVWGIRKASDLDIIVTPELYDRLKQQGWQEGVDTQQEVQFKCLQKEGADVTTVQDKPTHGDYLPDRVQLIKEAVIINGVPFVRVEEVIACKKAYNRPKDLADITAIEKYLEVHKGQDIY